MTFREGQKVGPLPLLRFVEEDPEVLRLAGRRDDVGFAVSIEVAGLDVLDRDLDAGDLRFAPLSPGVIDGSEELDAGLPGHVARMYRAPTHHDLVGADAKEIIHRDGVTILDGVVENGEARPQSRTARGLDVDGSDASADMLEWCRRQAASSQLRTQKRSARRHVVEQN